jgi:hypothetical protein
MTSTAGVPEPPEPAKGESHVERLRRLLEQPVTVDLQNVPLAAALESLGQQVKLGIVLDKATVAGLGLTGENETVTLKFTNARLKTVLRTALAQFNLTYVIDQDIVVATSEAVAHERQVRQRVSVDFDQLPLDRALRQLGRETGTNLVLDPRQAAKGKTPVTLRLDDVPLEVAVRLIAEVAGLRSVRQSNVLFITTKDVAAELKREEEGPAGSGVSLPSVVERVIHNMGAAAPGVPVAPAAPPPAANPNPNPGN